MIYSIMKLMQVTEKENALLTFSCVLKTLFWVDTKAEKNIDIHGKHIDISNIDI